MTLRHHPEEALLLDHASGAAGSAASLAVATHLWFCAQCRRVVALAEGVGGVLLDQMTPAPLAPSALAATLRKLDENPLPVTASLDGTPAPLRAALGRDLSALRWRNMGPRLAYIPLSRHGGTAVRLLRGAPGTDVGRHGHRGQEYTLVLSGGYTDETGSYGPGDFQTASASLRHNPIADPGGDCINLAVTTAPLMFDGLAQKIAGKLFGF